MILRISTSTYQLTRFRRFLPEHQNKKLYGMLSVVDAPDDLRQEALAQGFYMAGIHDQQFIIETPNDFVPKSWCNDLSA